MHKVTIVCTTFNNHNFVAQALQSFVEQKTNFDFEIVISDDASNDGTQLIIKEYEKNYPNIIKPIYREINIGAERNFLEIFDNIHSEYVVVCEGDDFFIDNNKLQLQVDFLDINKEYSICFHPVRVFYECASHPDSIFPSDKFRFYKTILTLDDLLKRNFIQTNSCMYRWRFNTKRLRDFFPKNILPRDYYLHLLHAEIGKIGFVDKVMTVYRKHKNGIWWGVGESDTWFLNCGLLHINFYDALKKNFNVNTDQKKYNMAMQILISALNNKSIDTLQSLFEIYPSLSKEILNLENSSNSIKEYKDLKKNIHKLSIALLVISILFFFSLCGYVSSFL